MSELLETKKNMAKAFYKLLIEHKNLPTDQKDSPQNIDKKVLRRRSIGDTARARIGVASDLSKPPSNSNTTKSRKRASTRTNQNGAQLPTAKVTSRPQPSNHHRTHQPHQKSTGTSSENHTSKGYKNVSNDKNVVWSSTEPDTKEFQLESNKSVSDILEALKHCFADLGQFDLSAKHTKNGLKVKARRSGKRHGTPIVTVNLLQREGDSSLIIKGGKSKEDFKEVVKKVEENLVA